MSNIPNAFARGKAFIGFVTGGDPSIEKTEEFVLAMIEAGANLVEIGVPFSDPIAEGPVIQRANIRALSAGARLGRLFELVENLRRKTAVPLVFLTYLNPVFRSGYEPFFKRCRDTGLDGVIIPDLPFEEQPELRAYSARHEVDLISLAAPTSRERIRDISRAATGFLYLVSSLGVTGERGKIITDIPAMVAEVKAAAAIPVAVGFGIHTPAQAAEIAKTADGVIVGSAIVRIVEEQGDKAAPHIYGYVKQMKEAIGGAEA
ncbi:MAG: tryptophan synthase subunit alpha [Spirochaetaceae bacterium]|jgi:tryptophan synthase alpha chain|nr:tryptophan synthase subunit alpha [Spirochaetaceae bacterium]